MTLKKYTHVLFQIALIFLLLTCSLITIPVLYTFADELTSSMMQTIENNDVCTDSCIISNSCIVESKSDANNLNNDICSSIVPTPIPLPEQYYDDGIFYPDITGDVEGNLTTHIKKSTYSPIDKYSMRDKLVSLCISCAETKANVYTSSAAMITSNATSIGLCSINVFKEITDTNQLYLYLAREEHMPTSPASVLKDKTTDVNLQIGNLLFIKCSDNIKESSLYTDVGIISEISEDTIKIIFVSEGECTQKSIKKESLSDSDIVLEVQYNTCENMVWQELKRTFPEYNDAVLCGLMANIYQESEYNSSAIGDDGMSYGLCQWYANRNLSLIEFAVANKLSIDNISTQIKFIKYELETDCTFSTLVEILKAIPNTKNGAYCAAYHICTLYESPDKTFERAKYRGNIANSRFAYYFPSEEDVLIEHNENNSSISNISNLDFIQYEKGQLDFVQFLPSDTILNTIYLDDTEILSEFYTIEYGSKIKITISQEAFDNLPVGWHDIYYVGESSITHGEIQVTSDLLSTEMAKPTIDISTTGLIITDAPAPRNAIDISVSQDYGVVMWYIDSTCYISTQRKNIKVTAPQDCSFLFSSTNDAEFLSNISYMDVSMLDISSVKDISFMFRGVGLNADKFELIGISNWDVSNISSARFTFCEIGFNASDWSIGDLKTWKLSNATDVTGMFMNAGHNALLWNIGDISYWSTPICLSMASMFEGAGYNSYSIILDLRNWDISNVVSLNSMFKNCGYNSEIFSLNILGWDTANVQNASDMFLNMGTSATSWALDSNINTESLSGW